MVIEAYGFTPDDDLLEKLFALNLELIKNLELIEKDKRGEAVICPGLLRRRRLGKGGKCGPIPLNSPFQGGRLWTLGKLEEFPFHGSRGNVADVSQIAAKRSKPDGSSAATPQNIAISRHST